MQPLPNLEVREFERVDVWNLGNGVSYSQSGTFLKRLWVSPCKLALDWIQDYGARVIDFWKRLGQRFGLCFKKANIFLKNENYMQKAFITLGITLSQHDIVWVSSFGFIIVRHPQTNGLQIKSVFIPFLPDTYILYLSN